MLKSDRSLSVTDASLPPPCLIGSSISHSIRRLALPLPRPNFSSASFLLAPLHRAHLTSSRVFLPNLALCEVSLPSPGLTRCFSFFLPAYLLLAATDFGFDGHSCRTGLDHLTSGRQVTSEVTKHPAMSCRSKLKCERAV